LLNSSHSIFFLLNGDFWGVRGVKGLRLRGLGGSRLRWLKVKVAQGCSRGFKGEDTSPLSLFFLPEASGGAKRGLKKEGFKERLREGFRRRAYGKKQKSLLTI
jgi:hypothetical protein